MFTVHNVTKKANEPLKSYGEGVELSTVSIIRVYKNWRHFCVRRPNFRDLTSLELSLVPQMFHCRYETNNCCKKWMSKIFLDVDILMLTRNMKLLHVNTSILHALWRVQRCFIRKFCGIYSISCDICAIPCDVYSNILWCMCNIVWYMLFGILKSIVTYILLCIFENIVVYVQ